MSDMEYITKEAAQRCLDDLSSDNLIGNKNDTFISLAEAKDKIEELPTADVIPKSVYNATQHILKGAFERIEQLDELCGELQKAKANVAQEIFASLYRTLDYYKRHREVNDIINNFFMSMEEVEKKYTEGE